MLQFHGIFACCLKMTLRSVEKRESLSKFREIDSSIFFSKNVAFTKYFSKMRECEYFEFPHCE